MEKIRRTFTVYKHIPFHNEKTKYDYAVELFEYYPRLEDWYKTAEEETYQWLVYSVQKNWTCLEVGGHIGETALLLSQMCSRVISFEPNEVSAKMFRKNVELNQLAGNGDFLNIELVVRPVGQYDGIMTEKLWLAGKDDKFGETVGEFNFLTIDKFTRLRSDINWVNLIFIDADGWDYDVILGAETTINKFRPFIVMEANYALSWRGHNIENIFTWANMHNYVYTYLDANCPGNMLLIPEMENGYGINPID